MNSKRGICTVGWLVRLLRKDLLRKKGKETEKESQKKAEKVREPSKMIGMMFKGRDEIKHLLVEETRWGWGGEGKNNKKGKKRK